MVQSVDVPGAASALGFAWLPYAVASVCLLLLVLQARRPSRRSVPGSVRAWLLVRAGVLGAVAVMSILLADAATEGDGLTAADQPIWMWLIHHRTGFLTAVLTGITQVGSTVTMAVAAALVVVVLAVRGKRRGDALLVAVVAIGAGALVAISKPLVNRVRPPLEFRLVTETNQSFPSGHALASAAIIGVLAVMFLPQVTDRRLRIISAVVAVLFVGLIGFSRMYLGVHWPTDVLGGWLIAAGWLVLCLTVRRMWIVRGSYRFLVSDT